MGSAWDGFFFSGLSHTRLELTHGSVQARGGFRVIAQFGRLGSPLETHG